jgi:ribosomal protein S18 acetylase RimI-like enzyme
VPAVSSLSYRTDLMIRAAEGSQIIDHGDCIAVHSPANPSHWWGNFLLLPAQAELPGPWLSRFAAEFPAAGHAALGVDSVDGASVSSDALLALGFSRDLTMVLTSPEPLPPAHPNHAAQIRRLAGADDWRQSAELWLACADDDDPGVDAEFLAGRAAARRLLSDTGRGAWFGAFAGSQLVAQLGIVADETGLARYQDVETHRAYRRQGLAGTLVYQAGQFARTALAARTLVICADPDGPAIGVYRSAGFAGTETAVGYARPPTA